MKRLLNILIAPLFVWMLISVDDLPTTVERPDLTEEEILAGCNDFGDIIDVRDESRGFGSAELITPANGGSFARVRIIDKTVASAKAYLERHVVDGAIVLDKRYQLKKEAIPLAIKQQVNQTGAYEGYWAEIRNWIYDKETGDYIP